MRIKHLTKLTVYHALDFRRMVVRRTPYYSIVFLTNRSIEIEAGTDKTSYKRWEMKYCTSTSFQIGVDADGSHSCQLHYYPACQRSCCSLFQKPIDAGASQGFRKLPKTGQKDSHVILVLLRTSFRCLRFTKSLRTFPS